MLGCQHILFTLTDGDVQGKAQEWEVAAWQNVTDVEIKSGSDTSTE